LPFKRNLEGTKVIRRASKGKTGLCIVTERVPTPWFESYKNIEKEGFREGKKRYKIYTVGILVGGGKSEND